MQPMTASDELRELQRRNPELAKAVETIRGVLEASKRVAVVQTQQARIEQDSAPQPVGGIYTSAA